MYWPAGKLGIVAAIVALVGTACGPEVRSLAVTPGEIHLSRVGATMQIDAEPRDKLGAKVKGSVISFLSREPMVASVSSTGLVTAKTHGTTTVVIQVEETEVMEFVHVTVRLPEKIVVRPGATTCYIAGVKRFDATVLDQSGRPFKNVDFEWSISDETKARMDDGELVGIEEGDVAVTAKAMGLEGTAKVNISWAPGQKALLEAEKRAGRGGRRGGRRGGGKQGGSEGDGWDPRLSMFDD